MAILFLKGRDPVDLWYARSEEEWICVGRGRCKRVDLTIVHSSSRLENCIMVVAKFIFQQFQNLKLLFPNPYGRFVADCLGSNYLWLRNLFSNDSKI
jgi:hypothetical protein